MRAKLRSLALAIRGSYWFIPALLTLAALILSFVTWALDIRLGDSWMGDFHYLKQTKAEGARTILQVIAGSTIGIAGTIFSITFAAVVFASGNYGPRLLSNFMNDRGNQVTLGVFIATFVFTLMTLRIVRTPDEPGVFGTPHGGFVPQISILTALGLAVLSVAVLVYFLHHMPSSIQINNVVARIGRTALNGVDGRYPDPWQGPLEQAAAARGEPVPAHDTGYIEVIDFGTLRALAQRQGAELRLAVRAGDFVHAGLPLAYIGGSLGDGCQATLRSAFAFGSARTPSQDIEFSIDELVEICLRALSPGINDPFTAITAIHWLGALTGALAARSLDRDPDGEAYGEGGVYCLADDFLHFLMRGFGATRGAVATSELAALAQLEAIEGAGANCPAFDRRAALRNEAERLMVQAQGALSGPALERVQLRFDEFRLNLPVQDSEAP